MDEFLKDILKKKEEDEKTAISKTKAVEECTYAKDLYKMTVINNFTNTIEAVQFSFKKGVSLESELMEMADVINKSTNCSAYVEKLGAYTWSEIR